MMTHTQAKYCHADFRLNTMNMPTRTAPAGDGSGCQWILSYKSLRRMVDTMVADYCELFDLGGDPLPGVDITPDAVIAKLGFAEYPEPRGILASAKFMAAWMKACTRAMFETDSEVAQRLNLTRPRFRQ